MKWIVIAAALSIAAPARAADSEMDYVTQALAHTECRKLMRIVTGSGPINENERLIKIAAMGIVVGRALELSLSAADFEKVVLLKLEMLGVECRQNMSEPWYFGITTLR